jgi:flagellar biosynthesis protein FliQ
VPKWLAVGAAIVLLLPWAMVVLGDYSRAVFSGMVRWFP